MSDNETINVDTNRLRELGQKFSSTNEQFEQWETTSASYWRTQADGCNWSHTTQSRQHFDALVAKNDSIWLTLSETGEKLGKVLVETATNFETADSNAFKSVL